MNAVDSWLDWLSRFHPLWEFLTGVGTLALAAVSFWLGTRKPKAKIEISRRRVGLHIFLSLSNTGEAVVVIARCYWRAPCTNGQVDLSNFALFNGAGPVPLLQIRLTRGDRAEIGTDVGTLCDLVNPHIPQAATDDEIRVCVADSRFECVTTTGEHFGISAPEETRIDLFSRLMLLRHGPA
jgi:hypothetical protein